MINNSFIPAALAIQAFLVRPETMVVGSVHHFFEDDDPVGGTRYNQMMNFSNEERHTSSQTSTITGGFNASSV